MLRSFEGPTAHTGLAAARGKGARGSLTTTSSEARMMFLADMVLLSSLAFRKLQRSRYLRYGPSPQKHIPTGACQ